MRFDEIIQKNKEYRSKHAPTRRQGKRACERAHKWQAGCREVVWNPLKKIWRPPARQLQTAKGMAYLLWWIFLQCMKFDLPYQRLPASGTTLSSRFSLLPHGHSLRIHLLPSPVLYLIKGIPFLVSVVNTISPYLLYPGVSEASPFITAPETGSISSTNISASLIW